MRATAALFILLVAASTGCGPTGPAYTTFVVHNDSAVELELLWFDAEHGPVVLAADGERFAIGQGHCSKSCDDLSPGMITCAAMVPESAITSGESLEISWDGQRVETSTNLWGESCLLLQPLPEETYDLQVCLRQVTETQDAPFFCKQQDFELRAEPDWQAAQRVAIHFSDADLP